MTVFKLRPLSMIFLVVFLIAATLFKNNYLTYFLIGSLLGAGLNYFQFGFRTCSQQLLVQGKTLGIRAIIVMLAVTTILFFPLLYAGHFGSRALTGLVEPLSLSVVFGAFIFGIGMQLSNGCTSGTFNRLGQLQPLSITALIFLIVGGTLAAYNISFWRELPALPAVSIINTLGIFNALLIQLGILGTLYFLMSHRERSRHQSVEPLFPKRGTLRDWHPWLLAGLTLAMFNTLLLITSGQPWSIASVLPVWGVKIGTQMGLPFDFSFWDYSITYSQRLETPVWHDTVSLTTWGVIFGAAWVTLFDKFRNQKSISATTPVSEHFMAILGGLLMGYGAVIAFGCNIGAFFSGIGSGSLHGWLWALSALMGNALIITLRRKGILARI
ncbi:YeeE/YedE family protein [Hydrogenovibrio marinus]|uniref:YeeE/YedE n=1 Tax=Hydrogenovibrio marinus TaxID=28885 RepID=A0A066ZSF5_HYDMR|nr:YeeE/YedE family protein [Hydrogenovibrio marinus]KDN96442.1 YeeE/YedE [Hydrogenovibrio marinus]BBN60362.1 membrane protein [Hydrogenovibrio marinus]